MSIKTFWTILLKILGIWLVIDSFVVIPQFFSALFLSMSYNTEMNVLITLGAMLLTITIFIFILYLFVFRTEWLIRKLKLEKGFAEERLELNLQQSSVLSIAIIVIGGIMLVESLPDFCRHVFMFYQENNQFKDSPSGASILFYGLKALAGYLLMTNSRFVVGFIKKGER
jgi:hypothetical protein